MMPLSATLSGTLFMRSFLSLLLTPPSTLQHLNTLLDKPIVTSYFPFPDSLLPPYSRSCSLLSKTLADSPRDTLSITTPIGWKFGTPLDLSPQILWRCHLLSDTVNPLHICEWGWAFSSSTSNDGERLGLGLGTRRR